MLRYERGEGLVDTVIACAIVSITLAALGSALVAATHRFGPDARREALIHAVARETRIAADLLKYEGASIAPAAIATSLPLAGASPLPVQLTISTSTQTDGSIAVAIGARDASGSTSYSATTVVPRPAPLPSSEVTAPLSGAAPL